jgi:hypothetical protein
MRLGPFNAESNKHAPTESQSHLVFLTEQNFPAERLLACPAALCSSMKVNNLACALAMVRHVDPWTEVVPAPYKIVIDAVGISDVPRSPGIDVKPPNISWLQQSQVTWWQQPLMMTL